MGLNKRRTGVRGALVNALAIARRVPTQNSSLKTQNSTLVDGEFIRKLDRLSLALGRDLMGGLMGEHRAVRRTSGIEFADYRQYSVGDDLRRVDWNAYARLGTLHVRQAQAEHDTALYLLVDASPSMAQGSPPPFDAARRLAAALGYIALSHLDTVVLAAPGADGVRGIGDWGLGTGDGGIPLSNPQSPIPNPSTQHSLRGRAEAASLFRVLGEMRTGAAVDFAGVLRGWSVGQGSRTGATAGRVALILSDLLREDYQEGVRLLVASGFQVTLLHLLSPDDMEPPDGGNMELEDSETGLRMEIQLGDESLREYRRRLDNWLSETQEWCRSNGAGYLLVQSDWDIERVILETLKWRRVMA